MTSSQSSRRVRRWAITGVLLAATLVGGYIGAKKIAAPAYRKYRAEKLITMARGYLAAGDYDNALLSARQALNRDAGSLANWQLAADAARAKGTPDIVYYQENVAKIDKTLAGQLEVIRLALKFGYYRNALDATLSIDKSAQQNADFHALAAQVYMRVGRPVAAKLHLYSLVELRPDDRAARLDLAEFELAEDTERKNRKLRDEVIRLSAEPTLRTRALGMLLNDAINGKDGPDAVKYVDQLLVMSDITSEQRVGLLSGLAVGDKRRADEYRGKLQTDFTNDPRGSVALIGYLVRTDQSAEARRWFASLSEKMRGDPNIQEAVANAYLALRDWPALDQIVANANWKEREFVRFAFIAFSARKNGNTASSANAWKSAVVEAGDNYRSAYELLRLAGRFGWDNEQYEVVWKLFALVPRNETIANQLVSWERRQGRTANLNRIFSKLIEINPADRVTKNNFAYASMLLESNQSKAYQFAKENYDAEPASPIYTTTYSFALYRQNKPADALALIESLRPSALILPERIMLRGLYRSALEDATGAGDLLSGLNSANFLPEERKLLDRARADIARVNQAKGQGARIDALSRKGAIDLAKGWLHLLSDHARTQASVDMKTADSLFALGDVRALTEELRNKKWGEYEYLRLALVAYLARGRSDEAETRSYWRTALRSAAGNEEKFKNLLAFATQWNWRAERMEVLGRLFEIKPTEKETLDQLIAYHKPAGRITDMVNALGAYLSVHPDAWDQISEHAYYSLLTGLNVSQVSLSAKKAHDADPSQTRAKAVYAFALWKQRRAQEAFDVIADVPNAERELVPVALLRAALLADLDRKAEAQRALADYNGAGALPQEAAITAAVRIKLKEDAAKAAPATP